MCVQCLQLVLTHTRTLHISLYTLHFTLISTPGPWCSLRKSPASSGLGQPYGHLQKRPRTRVRVGALTLAGIDSATLGHRSGGPKEAPLPELGTQPAINKSPCSVRRVKVLEWRPGWHNSAVITREPSETYYFLCVIRAK